MVILKRCHLSRDVDYNNNEVCASEVEREEIVAGTKALSFDDCSTHNEISNNTDEEHSYVQKA